MEKWNRNQQGRCSSCGSRTMPVNEIDEERRRSGWNPYRGEEEAVPQGRDRREWDDRSQGRDGREWNDRSQDRGGREWDDRSQGRDGREWNDRSQDRSREWNNMSQERGSREWNDMPQGRSGRAWDDMPQECQQNWQGMMSQPWGDGMEAAMESERDLRMLQSMFPQTAKMLLPHIEEACDKMEYEGSMMYDQYPDAETVRRIQESILAKVADQFPQQQEEAPDEMLMMQVPGGRRGQNWPNDLIRVLLLQEMHHRRCRHRGCRGFQPPRPPRRPYPPRR